MPSENPNVHKTAAPDWDSIAARPAFQELLRVKTRFLTKMTVFFLIYFFALPISVGWFPEFMKKEVLGKVNLAYLFALSQFFMAWILAALYVRQAAKWDKMNAALLAEAHLEK
ncbi:DUF485 domain-containing protein [Verrucomicrobium sp. BvORR034]|uniref:DUF485 domain-containing protein n=1 Tax=Verrucomicrobium sp. BvORR034 TaxID=1396418 RepID=UPI0006794C38|nr:DUF485 domain-containing protein [Verrucomicrobium sp. BvORR034]